MTRRGRAPASRCHAGPPRSCRVVSAQTPSIEWDEKKSKMRINGEYVKANVPPTHVIEGAARLEALADAYADRLISRPPPSPTPKAAKSGFGLCAGAWVVTTVMWIWKSTA